MKGISVQRSWPGLVLHIALVLCVVKGAWEDYSISRSFDAFLSLGIEKQIMFTLKIWL